jgi:hypothetical protein
MARTRAEYSQPQVEGYTVTVAAKQGLTVRLSEAQADVLAKVAELEQRSKGSVVRRLVDQLDTPDDVRDSGTAVEDR